MRTLLHAALFSAITSVALTGCDFFHELESEADAGGTETGATTDEFGDEFGDESGGEACDVLDDRCGDQDTLYSCNFETGEVDLYYCAALCGEDLLNFSCVPSADFRHACWCVSPGTVKIDTCAQLESCIDECGGDPGSPCTNSCFERTDAQTVRLLGTLFSCADRTCDDLCEASPSECGSCLVLARAGLWGDCGLEREVCDADESDEPSWP